MKNHRKNHPQQTSRSAFTLIEIIVVIAVIALIATMAVPALNGVMKGSKMTQSSDEFERDIARARAAAMRTGEPVEFRFYEVSDPEAPNSEETYRAYQAVQRVRDPEDHTLTADIIPISEVRMLPPGIVFSDNSDYSTLLEIRDIPDNTAQDWGDYNDALPRVDSADYKAFYFRPDGSTNLATINPSTQWCVTIVRENVEDLPPDFVTFQVDAYNGQVRRYEKSL